MSLANLPICASPQTPLVTIGITAYNAARTLPRALHSARAQNWPHTEIMIVDDASSDETPALLREWQQQDPALRIVTNAQNKGVAACRNIIVSEAKGDYIAFFDDDDQSAPGRVRTQYEALNGRGMALCHTARLQIYPDGASRTELPLGAGAGASPPQGKAVAQRILYGRRTPHVFGSTATCSQMASAATYRTLGGFDENFRRSEDTDLAVRAALAGALFIGIATPLVTQTMTMSSEKKLQDEKKYFFMLLEKHRAFLEEEGELSFTRAWFDAKYDYLQGDKAAFARKFAALAARNPLRFLRRVGWALPNLTYNRRYKSFHGRISA